MDKQVNVYGEYQSQFHAMEITFTVVFAIELAVNMYCHWYEGFGEYCTVRSARSTQSNPSIAPRPG